MRVKVTSTCDMNEASSVVVELLVRVQEQLRSLSNQRFNYWQVSDLLTQINSTREALANIDQNLELHLKISFQLLDKKQYLLLINL